MALIVKTQNFELALYAQGEPASDKIALVLPGLLDTKDYAHMRSHVDFLANRGFYALSVDPPSTWESPGDLINHTTTNYIKAVHELIAYYDNRPTMLVGHSRGGAVSMIVGTENEHVTHIVSIAGSWDQPNPPTPERIVGDVQLSWRDVPPGDVRTKEQVEFRLPLHFFEDAKLYNPDKTFESCDKPKLIIAPDQDEICSPEVARQHFDRLTGPKTFQIIQSTHDYRRFPTAIDDVNNYVANSFLL